MWPINSTELTCLTQVPISDHRVLNSVLWSSTQAPQSRTKTCFSEEANCSPMVTYVFCERCDTHSGHHQRLENVAACVSLIR